MSMRLLATRLPALRSSFVWPGRSSDAEEVLWNELVPHTPVPSLRPAFEQWFKLHVEREQRALQTVIFGEQHHQPDVLAAQLASLEAFVNVIRSPSANPGPIHLVLEHFSLLDQPLLDLYATQQLSDAQLIERYEQESHEGFHLTHYMPLLKLARQLGVRLVAGFPPRTWAQLAFHQGLDLVQQAEQRRVVLDGQVIPGFTRWDLVAHVSYAHSAYLGTLMRPDTPPTFPSLVPEPDHPDHPYPTDQFPPRPPQQKGFELAQVLKDAYLAHAIASQLRSTNSDQARPAVFAVTGLGHCEYGQGAVERLVQLLVDAPEEEKGARPLTILTKPDDAGLWVGTPVERTVQSVAPTDQEHEWARAAADAVVLYEWQD